MHTIGVETSVTGRWMEAHSMGNNDSDLMAATLISDTRDTLYPR